MRHTPVLLQEVINGLALKKGGIYVDCNLGDGGHSEVIAQKLAELGGGTIIGFDLDQDAIDRATANFKAAKLFDHKTVKNMFFRKNFRFLEETLKQAGINAVDGILFDLGLSSYELDASGRGFTFQKDEPLQMTFGGAGDHRFTAEDIVNTWSEQQIESIINGYGEDKFSRRIARAIIDARGTDSEGKSKDGVPVVRISTTAQLAAIIHKSVPFYVRAGRIHPATKTFQALRIAVNDELSALEEALPQAVAMLAPKGRVAVISYHSLEDRIVKRFFRTEADEERIELINKKPITSSDEEQAKNPRSRSAKFRVIEKI